MNKLFKIISSICFLLFSCAYFLCFYKNIGFNFTLECFYIWGVCFSVWSYCFWIFLLYLDESN